MPDYKVAGANLRKQMYSYYYDDTADLYYAADRENMDKGVLEASGFAASPSKWEKLELPELGPYHYEFGRHCFLYVC